MTEEAFCRYKIRPKQTLGEEVMAILCASRKTSIFWCLARHGDGLISNCQISVGPQDSGASRRIPISHSSISSEPP